MEMSEYPPTTPGNATPRAPLLQSVAQLVVDMQSPHVGFTTSPSPPPKFTFSCMTINLV